MQRENDEEDEEQTTESKLESVRRQIQADVDPKLPIKPFQLRVTLTETKEEKGNMLSPNEFQRQWEKSHRSQPVIELGPEFSEPEVRSLTEFASTLRWRSSHSTDRIILRRPWKQCMWLAGDQTRASVTQLIVNDDALNIKQDISEVAKLFPRVQTIEAYDNNNQHDKWDVQSLTWFPSLQSVRLVGNGTRPVHMRDWKPQQRLVELSVEVPAGITSYPAPVPMWISVPVSSAVSSSLKSKCKLQLTESDRESCWNYLRSIRSADAKFQFDELSIEILDTVDIDSNSNNGNDPYRPVYGGGVSDLVDWQMAEKLRWSDPYRSMFHSDVRAPSVTTPAAVGNHLALTELNLMSARESGALVYNATNRIGKWASQLKFVRMSTPIWSALSSLGLLQFELDLWRDMWVKLLEVNETPLMDGIVLHLTTECSHPEYYIRYFFNAMFPYVVRKAAAAAMRAQKIRIGVLCTCEAPSTCGFNAFFESVVNRWRVSLADRLTRLHSILRTDPGALSTELDWLLLHTSDPTIQTWIQADAEPSTIIKALIQFRKWMEFDVVQTSFARMPSSSPPSFSSTSPSAIEAIRGPRRQTMSEDQPPSTSTSSSSPSSSKPMCRLKIRNSKTEVELHLIQ